MKRVLSAAASDSFSNPFSDPASGPFARREGITRVLSAPAGLAAGREAFMRVLSALSSSLGLVLSVSREFSVTRAFSFAVVFLTGMKRVLSSLSAVGTAADDLIFVLSLSPGLFILIRPLPCSNSVPYRRMKLFLGYLVQ